MANHTVDGAIASLNRKHDIQVDKNETGIGGTIKLLYGKKAKGDIGISSKGKISFLENHEGFRKQWIDTDA